MEMARWVFCAVVSCALVTCIVGKTVSLNDLIDSESNQIEPVHTTTSPKIEELEPAAVRFSLNKGLKPSNRLSKKDKETGTKLNLIPLGKRISPIQYRKTFQIKSPLKPKRVKQSIRTRHKRKNQSFKREIDGHALLNQKYIPLLKSLGMLFDNILGSDSSESLEETKQKRKRLRYILEGDDDISCECPRRSEPNAEYYSEEETVTATTTVTPQISVTTPIAATTTDHPSTSNFRGVRHHQNVPLLLSRDTSSSRRNHHGVGERSRTAYNGSAERFISGDHGDSEYNSEWGKERADAESYEDYTNSDPRNYAGGAGTRGTVRDRELRSDTEEVHKNDAAFKKIKTKKLLEVGKVAYGFNAPIKLKNKRDQRKSGKLLPKPFRSQRGSLPDNNVVAPTEPVQPKDDNKESIVNVAFDGSGNQRLFDRNGSHSSEDQKANERTETVTDLPIIAVNSTQQTMKLSKVIEMEDRISESAQSVENDLYEKLDNTNVTNDYIITTDFPNTNIDKAEELTDNLILGQTVPEEEPVEDFQYPNQPEIETLYTISTETDGSGKGKVSILHGKSGDPVSYEDTQDSKISELQSQTAELKPPQVEIPSIFTSTSKSSRSKGPMVMIIDGYSVTRHKNGENKLAEKAIRIRP